MLKQISCPKCHIENHAELPDDSGPDDYFEIVCGHCGVSFFHPELPKGMKAPRTPSVWKQEKKKAKALARARRNHERDMAKYSDEQKMTALRNLERKGVIESRMCPDGQLRWFSTNKTLPDDALLGEMPEEKLN